METKLNDGDAGYALYENVVIQAQSRDAYHVSGGQVNPGTATNELTVAVEPGEASINDTSISWARDEPTLPSGGRAPSGGDTNDPRVDVIYAEIGPNGSGSIGVEPGVPAPYAPDTRIDENGNEVSYTPAPFEHWEPAPNDGSGVGGVVLALVRVESGDTAATDLTQNDIKNFKVGASDASVYVRGDGVASGAVHIAVDNDPVTISDQATPSGGLFAYDPNENSVVIGSDSATPTLGARLDTQNEDIFFDSRLPNPGGVFTVKDENPNASNTAIAFYEDFVTFNRDLNLSGNELRYPRSVIFDNTTDVALDLTRSDGVAHLWDIKPPGNEDTWIGISNPGANVANPPVFGVANQTAGKRAMDVAADYTTRFYAAVNMQGNDFKDVRNVEFQDGSRVYSAGDIGHLYYEAPDGTFVDLMPNKGDLSK